MSEHPDCPIDAADLAAIDALLGDLSEVARGLPKGCPDTAARDILRATMWRLGRAEARGLLPAAPERLTEYQALLIAGLVQFCRAGEPLWAVVTALDDLQEAGTLSYPAVLD